MSNDDRIRIAIVDPDRALTAAVAQAVAVSTDFELVASAPDPRTLVGALADKPVDALVLEVSAAGIDPAASVRELLERRPTASLIATGRSTTAGAVGRIIAAGAATYLPKPFQPDELLAMVRELRRAPRRSAAAHGARARRGSVVSVYSPKGGVGTTTVATSLAVALAARGNTRVAIVDLDLQFGDVGVVHDLKATSSIADLLGTAVAIDDGVIAEVFARHSSGVQALLAPQEPTDIGSIDVPEVIRLLDRLRAAFDYVVCDLWSSLEELALAVLQASDRVVLVTTPEVPSLRHLRRIMNATGTLLAGERTAIVANRAPSKVGVSVPEIERSLGMPVAAQIPSDGIGVTKAINEGMSMMDPRASVRVAKAFRDLADVVVKDLGHQREPQVVAKPQVIAS